MKNAAFIDLDGVVANSSLRFNKAKSEKDGSIDWSIAFDPDLIRLDTLMVGADEALHLLQKEFTIVLFSSRPESLRTATNTWLQSHGKHGIPHSHLVLKPSAAQFQKTTTWKAATMQTLALFMDVKRAIFIDDEYPNISEVIRHHSMREDTYSLAVYSTLQDAVGEIDYREINNDERH